MIKFSEIENLFNDGKFTHVRIFDVHKNRIFDIAELETKVAMEKLKQYEPYLRNYGKLVFKCGTEAHEKNNFVSAVNWNVDFGTGAQAPMSMGTHPPTVPGTMSLEMLNLHKDVIEMKCKMEYDKKERELEVAMKAQDGFMQYLPLAGLVMDISDEKLSRVLKLHQLNGLMNGTIKPQALAGKPEENATQDLNVQGTDSDKVISGIEKTLEKISENEKVKMENVLKLLEAIEKKPALVDQALLFI